MIEGGGVACERELWKRQTFFVLQKPLQWPQIFWGSLMIKTALIMEIYLAVAVYFLAVE